MLDPTLWRNHDTHMLEFFGKEMIKAIVSSGAAEHSGLISERIYLPAYCRGESAYTNPRNH